jgi:predicted alpha/beta hydrolase
MTTATAALRRNESSQLTLVTEDGFPLTAHRWHAQGKLLGVVLIAPATAVRQRVYATFAAYLSEQGFEVITWDWRGIGDSRHEAGSRDRRLTMRAWGECDLAAAIDWADRRADGAPVAVVGHSFGGAAIGMAANAARLDRAVLITAPHGWWGHWPRSSWWKLLPLWYLLLPATTTLFGSFPSSLLGLGENLPLGVAREAATWCRRRDYLRHWTGHAAFRRPILSIAFSDDPMAPREAVRALLAEYRLAEIDDRQLAPADVGQSQVGHFGFFDAGVVPQLWADVLRFLQATDTP